MELKKVTSSNLNAVGYDEPTQSLVVEFKNGTLYRFEEVPLKIFNAMLLAPSLGKYFNAVIRKHFTYTKINIPGEEL